MGRIPEHVVEEVRERADIVSIVSRHITLKESGPRLWGLCPFHDEKTPSFQVHRDRQIFYCFGCRAGGDVFSFTMRQSGLDFPDAVRALARELSVEIPETGRGGDGGRVAAIYRVNDTALDYFRLSLRSDAGRGARAYLEERGVPADLVERFQLGFAPPGWDGLLRHLGRDRDALAAADQAGLIVQRQTGDGHYDRFRERLMFPIAEPSGHVVGFGGRVFGGEDDAPKYMNSPESPAYRKSRALFGLPLALDAMRKRGRVIVVEGYFDLIALHRAGLAEVVAPCGTALTAEHARRLRRYTNEVVLLFDGDAAGQQAAERTLPVLLAEGLRARAAFLPAGADPDDLLARSGPEALCAVVEQAVKLLDHMIDRALLKVTDDAWEMADAARQIEPLLRAIQDPIERRAYTRKFSSLVDLPPDALAELLEREAARPLPAPPMPIPGATQLEVEPAASQLVAALAAYPEILETIERLEPDWLPPGDGRELLDSLREATRRHGRSAVAQLVRPGADELRDELKSALPRIVLQHEPWTLRAAEQAARECVAQLGRRSYDRKLRVVRSRLESCSDTEQVSALLEEQQRYMAERQSLLSQSQQV